MIHGRSNMSHKKHRTVPRKKHEKPTHCRIKRKDRKREYRTIMPNIYSGGLFEIYPPKVNQEND